MLSIKFTDAQGKVKKIYTAVGLKSGIVDKLLGVAEKQAQAQQGEQSAAEQKALWSEMMALIVEVFGRQFTYDELADGADIQEIVRCFQSLNAFVTESVSKN